MNIIVTGASRGVGYQAALKFAADNKHHVLALSRNKKKLDALEKESRAANPGSGLVGYDVDLENLGYLEKGLRDRIFTLFDSLDILINNAGFLVRKPLMDTTQDELSRTMTVNFTAPMLLVRTLMPLLEKAPAAHVVNIGSMAGIQGSKKFPGLSAYSASKAALHVLTECLAEEFSGSTVRFNALALGAVETEMFMEAFPNFQAPLKASQMADFVMDFALRGHYYFNGKILPVSLSTP